MERFMMDRCDFCLHRNGLLCSVSHRDCKPGLEPCPYEEDRMYPCRYSANDNVRRFLESQGIKVELRDNSTTEEDIKEARRVVEQCIEENVQKAKEAIAKVSGDNKLHDEFVVKRQIPVEISFTSSRKAPSRYRILFGKPNRWSRIKKLFKK